MTTSTYTQTHILTIFRNFHFPIAKMLVYAIIFCDHLLIVNSPLLELQTLPVRPLLEYNCVAWSPQCIYTSHCYKKVFTWNLVKLLWYWYSHQVCVVTWNYVIRETFDIQCEVISGKEALFHRSCFPSMYIVSQKTPTQTFVLTLENFGRF